MNSARRELLATMPPTFAAARMITCGRVFANQSNTAAWLHRSSSRRSTVTSLTFSRSSRRASALPTMPRWPATKTLLPVSSNGTFATRRVPFCVRQITRQHLGDELCKAPLRRPAEHLARLAGVANEEIDLGGAEIGRIDLHDRLAARLVDAGLLDSPRHAMQRPTCANDSSTI